MTTTTVHQSMTSENRRNHTSAAASMISGHLTPMLRTFNNLDEVGWMKELDPSFPADELLATVEKLREFNQMARDRIVS